MEENPINTYKRNVDLSNHIQLGAYWFEKINTNNHSIVYCAFEFRLAIERLTYQIFVMAHRNKILSGEIDPSSAKDFKDAIRLIYENQGNRKNLYNHYKFTQIYVKNAFGLERITSIPDFSVLINFWHKLSELCHYHDIQEKTWGNTDWINSQISLLNSVDEYFKSILSIERVGWLRIESMPEALQDVYIKFIKSEYTEEQVIRCIIITKPIVEKWFFNIFKYKN